MFVCEFMQDIAEFDSCTAPAKVTRYRLKKKENGYWKASDLTGQTDNDKNPKQQKPVPKLYKSILAFKKVQARGVFVSNAKFEVDLARGWQLH
jgi:Cap4 dsDNA endonuclease